MGIERFFKSVEENAIANLEDIFTHTFKHRLPVKEFYIDFNSMVHVTSNKTVSELNMILANMIFHENEKEAKKYIQHFHISEENLESPEQFKQFVAKNIDDWIVNDVANYVEKIIENYLDSKQLELLYIAMDGVPTQGKILEQKKRRYMGVFIQKIEKKIYEKYKDIPVKRQLYEKNKIEFWNKSLITPGSTFMDKMGNKLQSEEFINRLKKITNLKTYIVSTVYEYGEGEKKIVIFINKNMSINNKPVLIFSPDSDMTLLGMLLKKKNVKILRHNQQKDNFDVIDIDKLEKNIFSFIQKKSKKTLDMTRVIQDLVFIFTIFGNDFVPRIESINVKYDFNSIIDVYVQVLKDKSYILDKKINFGSFYYLISLLKKSEKDTLRKNWMLATYKNFPRVLRAFDPENRLSFYHLTEKFNTFVKQYEQMKTEITKTNTSALLHDKHFANHLYHLVSLGRKDPDTFEEEYLSYYRDKHRFPMIEIYLKKFTHTINDEFHQRKLEQSKHKLIPYDLEIYKFENLLDEYRKNLNVIELELGRVRINRDLTWAPMKMERQIQEYYQTFFPNTKPEKLVEDYLMGLTWVFDYYYGEQYDNLKTTSTWYYSPLKAPLMEQIDNYLKNKKNNIFEQMQKKVRNTIIPATNWFNPWEHLTYVTAIVKENIPILPKQYLPILDTLKIDKDYFDKLAENVLSGKSKDVDCRGAIFLNKCLIPLAKKNQFYDISNEEFLKLFNKIKIKSPE